MTSGMRVLLAALSAALLAAYTRDGDTILMPDPTEETASQAPLVTVVYDANALGDRSYNDLVYEGVERAAGELGLRTMQLSPQSKEEGERYLELIFMETVRDTVRRLFIVALLEGIAGVLAMSSAGTHEQSFADNWSPTLGVWRQDRFTHNLVSHLTANPATTYRDLDLYCAQHTLGSHVHIVNAARFSNLYTTGPQEFFTRQ